MQYIWPFLSLIVCVDRQKIKQNWWLSRKFDFFTEIGAWYVKLKMVQVKYVQFSPRCRKPHVKGQSKYGLICFCPLHLTSCLHDANDFRLYSQLSLPIWRLSAYTLWYNHNEEAWRKKVENLFNSKFILTSRIAGNKHCCYKEGWLYSQGIW